MEGNVSTIFSARQKNVQAPLFKIKIIKFALENHKEKLVQIHMSATLTWLADHQIFGLMQLHARLLQVLVLCVIQTTIAKYKIFAGD